MADLAGRALVVSGRSERRETHRLALFARPWRYDHWRVGISHKSALAETHAYESRSVAEQMNSLCPFCAIGRGEADADLVAFRTDNVFVIPSLKQRHSNPGQMLVCPVAHEASFPQIQVQLLDHLFQVVARVARAAPQAFEAVGTAVLLNSGAPDQTIAHLHVHVIPRFKNDNLVIPNSDDSPAPTALRLELARRLRSALS